MNQEVVQQISAKLLAGQNVKQIKQVSDHWYEVQTDQGKTYIEIRQQGNKIVARNLISGDTVVVQNNTIDVYRNRLAGGGESQLPRATIQEHEQYKIKATKQKNKIVYTVTPTKQKVHVVPSLELQQQVKQGKASIKVDKNKVSITVKKQKQVKQQAKPKPEGVVTKAPSEQEVVEKRTQEQLKKIDKLYGKNKGLGYYFVKAVVSSKVPAIIEQKLGEAASKIAKKLPIISDIENIHKTRNLIQVEHKLGNIDEKTYQKLMQKSYEAERDVYTRVGLALGAGVTAISLAFVPAEGTATEVALASEEASKLSSFTSAGPSIMASELAGTVAYKQTLKATKNPNLALTADVITSLAVGFGTAKLISATEKEALETGFKNLEVNRLEATKTNNMLKGTIELRSENKVGTYKFIGSDEVIYSKDITPEQAIQARANPNLKVIKFSPERVKNAKYIDLSKETKMLIKYGDYPNEFIAIRGRASITKVTEGVDTAYWPKVGKQSYRTVTAVRYGDVEGYANVFDPITGKYVKVPLKSQKLVQNILAKETGSSDVLHLETNKLAGYIRDVDEHVKEIKLIDPKQVFSKASTELREVSKLSTKVISETPILPTELTADVSRVVSKAPAGLLGASSIIRPIINEEDKGKVNSKSNVVNRINMTVRALQFEEPIHLSKQISLEVTIPKLKQKQKLVTKSRQKARQKAKQITQTRQVVRETSNTKDQFKLEVQDQKTIQKQSFVFDITTPKSFDQDIRVKDFDISIPMPSIKPKKAKKRKKKYKAKTKYLFELPTIS